MKTWNFFLALFVLCALCGVPGAKSAPAHVVDAPNQGGQFVIDLRGSKGSGVFDHHATREVWRRAGCEGQGTALN